MQPNTRLATKELGWLTHRYTHTHTHSMQNRMLQEGYLSHEMVIISASRLRMRERVRTTATQSDSISPLVKVAPWARLVKGLDRNLDGSRCYSPLLWLPTILDRDMIFFRSSPYIEHAASWHRCFIHLRMFVYTGCPKKLIYIFFNQFFLFSILHDL